MANVKSFIHGASDFLRLNHIADTKSGDHCEDGKGIGKPLPIFPKPVLDIVHRAANKIAIFVLLAEFHCADRLGVFCCHNNKRCHPHPEDCARPTGNNSGYDTGNITGSDSCRQRCHKSVEGADLASGIAGNTPFPKK